MSGLTASRSGVGLPQIVFERQLSCWLRWRVRSGELACEQVSSENDEIEARHRTPDVRVERRHPSPCTAVHLERAFQRRDASFNPRTKVAQPTEHPCAPDHVADLETTLAMEGDVLDAQCFGGGDVLLGGKAAVEGRLPRSLSKEIDVPFKTSLDESYAGRVGSGSGAVVRQERPSCRFP